jgi:hypothetical protein
MSNHLYIHLLTFSFSTIKHDIIPATIENPLNMIIGIGASNSTASGAMIVMVLASTLARPNAVCEY